jgi:dethiobiotin synthetase
MIKSDPYEKDSDARFIYKHVGQLTKKDPADSIVYCFREPKAPYFASRNEGKTIELKAIQNALDKKSRIYLGTSMPLGYNFSIS